jgi:hypothetical protein
MNKTKLTMSFLAAFLFVITCATAGQASAQRTFVAGPGIGNDSNTASDCSFSAPCRNFSVAYTVTNTGGEIIALSPGVGYGALTITHAITVTGLPGQVAFVAVSAGTTGFTVNAGATDQVVIRNITFNGSNAATSTGLSHTSGKLVVEGCTFTQLATGITIVNTTMALRNSTLTGNTIGASVSGTGTTSPSVAATALLTIDGGSITYNGTGIHMINPGNNPLYNVWVHTVGGAWLTNMMGNTIGVDGTGTGCPCSNTQGYSNGDNPH